MPCGVADFFLLRCGDLFFIWFLFIRYEATIAKGTQRLRQQAEEVANSQELMRDYQQETTRSQDELKHTRACLSTFESRVEMITMQKDNAEGQFAKLTQEMEVLRQEHAATSSSGSVEQQQQHQEMQHSVQMAHKEIENLALQIEGVEDELSAARVTNKQVNDYIYIIVIYILYPPPPPFFYFILL